MSHTIQISTAHVEGGREGSIKTPNGALNVPLGQPSASGEQAIGTNPEQLFAAGYSACFGSSVQAVGRKQKLGAVKVIVDGTVGLVRNDENNYGLSVALAVTLPEIDDPELARALVIAAHEMCPYSRSIRGNVDVDLSVNGVAINSLVGASALT